MNPITFVAVAAILAIGALLFTTGSERGLSTALDQKLLLVKIRKH